MFNPQDLQLLQERQDTFIATSKSIEQVPTQYSTVDSLIQDTLRFRNVATTPENKQSISAFLNNMLLSFMDHKDVSSVTKARFNRLPNLKPQQHCIPAIVLSGYYPTKADSAPYSLCGLGNVESLAICKRVYDLLFESNHDTLMRSLEFSINAIKNLLKGDDDPTSPMANQRYQQFVAFVYESLDLVEVPIATKQALENELQSSALFAPYVKQEQQVRVERKIAHMLLFQEVYNHYHSQSWIGWFWNTILCGVFGKHESATIVALKTLLKEEKTFYTENEIKDCLSAEPKYQAHRLGFFSADHHLFPITSSGTDCALVNIQRNLCP